MQGAPNFRDVAGYRLGDGAIIKPGRIYRSGSLAYLTSEDQTRFESLGIRCIIDLRSSGERHAEQSGAITAGIDTWAGEDLVDYRTEMAALLRDPALTPDKARAFVMSLYARLPFVLKDAIIALLHAIAARRVPILVHCAAGKDRTGIAMALLLHAAGARYEDILADYMRSAALVDLEADLRARRGIGWNEGDGGLQHIARETRAAMLATEPLYLTHAFDAIAAKETSVDSYIRNILGISDESRKMISHALTS